MSTERCLHRRRFRPWLALALAPALGLLLAADPELLAVPPLPKGLAPTGTMPQELVDAARRAARKPLAERMAAVSEPMLGRPYARDPLGEGEGTDPDPRARYDAFDCLTFVEETLALSFSAEPTHAAFFRRQLRYGSQSPTYAHRRHFMELQWIPGNVADGFIESTAHRYGDVEHREKVVDTGIWRRWGRRSLFKLAEDELPVGTMSLDILPLERAIAVADELAPGSLLLQVHEDRAGTPMWTTHVGFVVEREGERFFRNASRRSAMRVRDEPLKNYLTHIRQYDGWPVSGIAVFEPREQLPRRAALSR